MLLIQFICGAPQERKELVSKFPKSKQLLLFFRPFVWPEPWVWLSNDFRLAKQKLFLIKIQIKWLRFLWPMIAQTTTFCCCCCSSGM
jgi:hypothetical protein